MKFDNQFYIILLLSVTVSCNKREDKLTFNESNKMEIFKIISERQLIQLKENSPSLCFCLEKGIENDDCVQEFEKNVELLKHVLTQSQFKALDNNFSALKEKLLEKKIQNIQTIYKSLNLSGDQVLKIIEIKNEFDKKNELLPSQKRELIYKNIKSILTEKQIVDFELVENDKRIKKRDSEIRSLKKSLSHLQLSNKQANDILNFEEEKRQGFLNNNFVYSYSREIAIEKEKFSEILTKSQYKLYLEHKEKNMNEGDILEEDNLEVVVKDVYNDISEYDKLYFIPDFNDASKFLHSKLSPEDQRILAIIQGSYYSLLDKKAVDYEVEKKSKKLVTVGEGNERFSAELKIERIFPNYFLFRDNVNDSIHDKFVYLIDKHWQNIENANSIIRNQRENRKEYLLQLVRKHQLNSHIPTFYFIDSSFENERELKTFEAFELLLFDVN